MCTFFKKHVMSTLTLLIIIVGATYIYMRDTMTGGLSPTDVIEHTERKYLTDITTTDKILGFVVGIGECYILVRCWLMEVKNEELKEEIKQLKERLGEPT